MRNLFKVNYTKQNSEIFSIVIDKITLLMTLLSLITNIFITYASAYSRMLEGRTVFNESMIDFFIAVWIPWWLCYIIGMIFLLKMFTNFRLDKKIKYHGFMKRIAILTTLNGFFIMLAFVLLHIVEDFNIFGGVIFLISFIFLILIILSLKNIPYLFKSSKTNKKVKEEVIRLSNYIIFGFLFVLTFQPISIILDVLNIFTPLISDSLFKIFISLTLFLFMLVLINFSKILEFKKERNDSSCGRN